LGKDFNSPPTPIEVVDDVSNESLPPTHSFCSVRADDLIISAQKKAAADACILRRLYEIPGKKGETPVIFLGMQPTFRETNLIEQVSSAADERLLTVGP
jgi:alpha-mannosidase